MFKVEKAKYVIETSNIRSIPDFLKHLNIYTKKMPSLIDFKLTLWNLENNSDHNSMQTGAKLKQMDFEFYEGEWRLQKMHGFGRLCTTEGHVYEGSFKTGLPDGKGRILYNTGDILDGEFVKGLVQGKGHFYTQDGIDVQGTFKNNVLNGEGEDFNIFSDLLFFFEN